MRVEQIMTRNVKACSVEDNLDRAASLMWEGDCGALPVLSLDGSGAVLGIITDRDISMAAYTQGKPLRDIPVSVAMARKVISCRVGDDLRQVALLMRDNQVRRLPVLDTYGRLQGIISLNDLAKEAERERVGLSRETLSLETMEALAQICRHRLGQAPSELHAAA